MKYAVQLAPSVKKQLKRLGKTQAERLTVAIYLLGEDPRPAGCKRLTGRDAYRVRVGDYRIIYEVHDGVLQVLVLRVGHRREVYKG